MLVQQLLLNNIDECDSFQSWEKWIYSRRIPGSRPISDRETSWPNNAMELYTLPLVTMRCRDYRVKGGRAPMLHVHSVKFHFSGAFGYFGRRPGHSVTARFPVS